MPKTHAFGDHVHMITLVGVDGWNRLEYSPEQPVFEGFEGEWWWQFHLWQFTGPFGGQVEAQAAHDDYFKDVSPR